MPRNRFVQFLVVCLCVGVMYTAYCSAFAKANSGPKPSLPDVSADARIQDDVKEPLAPSPVSSAWLPQEFIIKSTATESSIDHVNERYPSGLDAVDSCVTESSNNDSGDGSDATVVAEPSYRAKKEINTTLSVPICPDPPNCPKKRPWRCLGGPSINAISEASPLVADCRELIAELEAGGPGNCSYFWDPCRQDSLIKHKSCVFGIETYLGWRPCHDRRWMITTRWDIIQWIQDSIDKWADVVGDYKKERVGAWGDTCCFSPDHVKVLEQGRYIHVKWGLYHSRGKKDTMPSSATLAAAPAREAFQDNNAIAPVSAPSTDNYHYCEGGPSVSALSAASPLVSDCRTLIDNLKAEEGNYSYKWISCKQHALASFKTCEFGIEHEPPSKCLPWTTLETGNGDIIDWIQNSIDTWGGVVGDDGKERVGTWGLSKCHNTGFVWDDYLPVKWGLYHSGWVEDSTANE